MLARSGGQHLERVERVELTRGGPLYDLEDVELAVDPALYYEARQWAGYDAPAQAVVDEYLRLHRKRHGAPFVLPLAA